MPAVVPAPPVAGPAPEAGGSGRGGACLCAAKVIFLPFILLAQAFK